MPPPAPSDASVVDALYRISSLVNEAEDPAAAFELILDQIIAFFPSATASIALINPDTQCLEIEVMRGLPGRREDLPLRVGEGITGWVALHGRAILVPDVRKEARYVCINPQVRCEMAVPMFGKDDSIVGVVNLDSAEVEAFDERDLKLLVLLTNEATRVVLKLWLIEELRQQADQLRALVNTTRLIVNKRELHDLLQSIAVESLALMHCRICAILLYEPKQQTLRMEALSGVPAAVGYTEQLRLQDSSLGTAIRRRKTIEVHDIARTEEHHMVDLVQSLGLQSLLSAPIIYEDEVIGVLNAYTDRPRRFSDSERRVFETLAGLSGVAIRNVRLYERIFRSEEWMRRSERLTMLGLLSSEIAHEIRNPLTVIRLLFESLDLQFSSEDPRAQDTIIIQDKLDQLEQIVGRVLNFGKSRENLRTRCDLGAITKDTLHLMRLKLQQNRIELVFEEQGGTVFVEVVRGQLQQALLNLVINAMQAMPDGGRLEIKIQMLPGGSPPIVHLDVTDTGPGVDPAIRDQIFDSFLSDKPGGTGLGLSIVKRIMRSHHGDVQLHTTGPAGTTMRLWLPCTE